jgi:hypothetical protein
MSNPWYKRKYKIRVLIGTKEVTLADSDNEQQGVLHCTFNIDRPGYKAPYYAEVEVWNTKVELENELFQAENAKVIVEAGYEDGSFGEIWNSALFQVLLDRENVTDYKLTLRCMDGLGLFDNNIVNEAMGAGATVETIVDTVTSKAETTIPIQYMTRDLKLVSLPRARILYGPPKQILEEIGDNHDAQMFWEDGKLCFSKITDSSNVAQAVEIGPDSGLIGTPQQIPYGVTFKCLLNPLLKIKAPPMLTKLNMTRYRLQKITQGALVSRLDQDGLYKVVKIQHIGDTRGNDWYTEVTGVNSDYQGVLPTMLGGVLKYAGGSHY